MYREPAPPLDRDAAASDFLYSVVDRERPRVTAIAAFQYLTLPVAAGVLLSVFIAPKAGLLGLIASAALAVRWLRAPRGGGVLLHVEGDELCVLGARTKQLKARLRLTDLADVTLDTKTIHPMMEGSNPIPGLRFIDSQALPEVDQKRILLVGRSGSVPLTEAYLASVDVTEWFGKIRVFLRRHGWVPESEREPAA
jgi:hypothetical protein